MLGDMRANQIVELELNFAKGWVGTDIRFLEKLTNLLVFEIFDFGIKDISPIHHLEALRTLGIATYCSTAIEFGAFPFLEDCGIEWRPRAKSLFNCVTLNRLFVNGYKGKDTDSFSDLVNLESLAIYNSPIRNLRGLSGLRKLQYLALAGLRKLESLDGIESLTELREMDINTCRSIRSIEPVRFLSRIKKLYINNCGVIDSLDPLADLTELEAVGFYASTNILNGDLSPLARLPRLRIAAFQNRSHYSHRREQLGDPSVHQPPKGSSR